MNRDESIQRFERYLKRRFPERRTAIDYVSDIRQFAAACDKAWREVSVHDIDVFVDQQRLGHSLATVQRRVAALKTFFDFLAEDSGELTWPNPVRFTCACATGAGKRHGGKLPQRLPRDLSDETVERVWNVITSPRDRAWFALMWRAGLRVGEVVDLKMGDLLSLAGGDRPGRLRVLGKGRKERIVLLSADACAVLQAWLDTRPASDQPYIFLNERGRPLKPNGILWLLHRYGEQVEVDLTPHQLRHTFARQVVEAGMPITSVGKLLGHANLSTTLVYTAGADPQLNLAYQNAMTRLTTPPAEPVPPPIEPTPAPAYPPTPGPLPAAPASVGTEPKQRPACLPIRVPPLPDWDSWATDLPQPIRQACLSYVQRRVSNWAPHRQRLLALKLLCNIGSFWKWQMAHRPISQLSELHLADLHAYQLERQCQDHVSGATINRTISYVLTALKEQAEEGIEIDGSLFRLRHLPHTQRLPRYLSETEYHQLEAYVLTRLNNPEPMVQMENACFFVLAHGGLRASECAYLHVSDVDLPGQRLLVRQAKNQKDRAVYLSDVACQALARYLPDPARSPSEPLWTYPNGHPIQYHWLRKTIAHLGQAAGVPDLTPHRLRHTLATRLLNAGMDITRIQKLLGHVNIKTTMVYAHVLDTTLETDYRRAMARLVHQHMPLSDQPVLVTDWPTPRNLESQEQALSEVKPMQRDQN
jgi:site-specific recombinase XerD